MLDRSLYTERVGAFSFDRLACLRNAYAKNDCRLCIDVCAHDAFIFEEGKLHVSALSCTQCGACIGGCPSHALSLYGFSVDTVLEKLKREETYVFTCKDSLPCVGALSVEAWSVLLLEGGREITCHLSLCEGCSLNDKKGISAHIMKRIEEANALVSLLGRTQKIVILQEDNPTHSSRRSFFKTFIAPAKVLLPEPAIPLKRLKKALKASLTKEQTITKHFSFIHQKSINPTCDNCKECVQFCPTQALSYDAQYTKILFQMGKCIGCSICEAICKKEAVVSLDAPFDIVHFAYDRACVLIEHDVQVCLTCKCAFSYKGGQKVCERCASFEKEHAELFVLASQSE